MRTAARRILPAAAAALPAKQAYDWKQECFEIRVVHTQRRARGACECQDHAKSNDLAKIVIGRGNGFCRCQDDTKGKDLAKILVGRGHWIYRLVDSEDIRKVYKEELELGKGGFGTVYLVKHKELGYRRALKKIAKTGGAQEQERLLGEIYTLMNLDHPHIVKLSRTYDDGKHLYIAQELCSGPDLLDRILDGKPMTEQEAGVALRHMLKAVLCCHSQYRGHYDIKPENFMFSDNDCKELKMIDLGMSSGFTDNAEEIKGTVDYMAPEVFHGMYGPHVDVWACGAVFFTMLTRSSLMCNQPEAQMIACLKDRHWIKQRLAWASKRISRESADLLSQMLCHDRHHRITAANALKHPFIQNTYAVGHQSPELREAAAAVIKSTPESFASFGSEPVLVRASLLLMAHLAYNEEAQAHHLAYSMLDILGNGQLSMESIEASAAKNRLRQASGDQCVFIPTNFDKAFRSVDPNGTGTTSFNTFLAATLPQSLRSSEELCRNAFALLDRNNDGVVDENDLAVAFSSGDKTTAEESKRFRSLCHDALVEVTGSSKKVSLDFDTFFQAILAGPACTANARPAARTVDAGVSVPPPRNQGLTSKTESSAKKDSFVSWFFESPGRKRKVSRDDDALLLGNVAQSF